MEGEVEESAGTPAWVMTFADLMSLLMVFFVLLLSFSEMDVAKFKELAGSVHEAFGVQTDVEVRSTPRGTSLIAREFSPGVPQPTAINTVRQFTVNSNFNTLDLQNAQRIQELDEQEEEAETRASDIREALATEIEEGRVLVRRDETDVIIQILEQDSFASGQAALQDSFLPTLVKIGELLATTPGAVSVSGHTDNVPISTSQFRSNWDLSAARAASVVFELLDAGVDPARIMVSGHADTQPRATNDTPENRALNRRVDITVITGKEVHASWVDDETGEASGEEEGDAEALAELVDLALAEQAEPVDAAETAEAVE